jgi:hypothetical protein
MDADFSIELGHEDPVLDFPWTDPEGKVAYFDLKRRPELVEKVEETQRFPELAEFLRAVNSARSAFESAKCDVWETCELSAEEEIFNASCKLASYVDLVFSDAARRKDFSVHERFAAELARLLQRAPQSAAATEISVRRLFFAAEGETREGFYFTIYTSGYGGDEAIARRNWGIAMKLTENAIAQLSLSTLAAGL